VDEERIGSELKQGKRNAAADDRLFAIGRAARARAARLHSPFFFTMASSRSSTAALRTVGFTAATGAARAFEFEAISGRCTRTNEEEEITSYRFRVGQRAY
jgi:hypothetical protein